MHEMLGGQCAKCGATDKLEIDHIDPETKIANVTRLWSKPWPVIEKELAKCQLLCFEHHKEKSVAEGSWIKNRVYGEENLSSKLTENDVRIIRESYQSGKMSLDDIAIVYPQVARSTLFRVIQNKTWKDPNYQYVSHRSSQWLRKLTAE